MVVRSGAEIRLDPVAIARATTAHGVLEPMGQWSGDTFARNNCCLFYKIPGGGKCGDCVLISGDALE
jgi:hypothetical protein